MSRGAAVERVVAKTLEYLESPSVVGFERPFLDHLASDFGALGCEVEREEKLLVVHREPSRPEFLSCHIGCTG
jgi:hypothetical protein